VELACLLFLRSSLHKFEEGFYLPDLLKFSMQLAMIKQLLNKGLITEKEYTLIKSRLMGDYNVLFGITTKTA